MPWYLTDANGDEVLRRSPLRVLFLPDWRDGNPYQRMLADALRRLDVEVSYARMPTGLFALNRLPAHLLGVHVIHLHWIPDFIDHIVWARNPLVAVIKRLLLITDVLLMRARGRKVVWTVHNLVSHETANRGAELSARRALARACSALVVHSPSAMKSIEAEYRCSLAGKTSVIRHGNFDGCYPPPTESVDVLRGRMGLKSTDLVLLFFGAIRGYKGLETLIAALRRVQRVDLKLVIAGRPFSDADARRIREQAAGDSRIVLRLGVVQDEHVAVLHQLASAVVIPFVQTLTSGSAILALTFGRPLLLPESARVLDLDGPTRYFRDLEDLVQVLESLKPDDLTRLGSRARAFAEELSWKVVGTQTCECYMGLHAS